MITRRFNPNEARVAVRFARDVYQYTFNPNFESVVNRDYFLQYANEDSFENQVINGQLTIFGTLNSVGEIVAVIAVDMYNYVTMLMVSPNYNNLGLGKNLLNMAEKFVKNRPGDGCIKINLTRMNLKNYFLGKRYLEVKNETGVMYPFIRLYKPLNVTPNNVVYEKKNLIQQCLALEH